MVRRLMSLARLASPASRSRTPPPLERAYGSSASRIRARQWGVVLLLGLLAGCGGSSPDDAGTDSGMTVDSGPPPPDCSNGADCALQGWDVCRQGKCARHVACADDVECGLGERCVGETCQFTGCTSDADCPTGRCNTAVFECAECGSNADCPATRPVCDVAANACVQCKSDDDCQPPGPGYCDASSGQCVQCNTSEQCPNGFFCDSDKACHGQPSMNACSAGVSCDLGLTCVTINGSNQCARGCSLYHPTCLNGDICYKLTFTSTNSLVFDTDGPAGVCFAKANGLKDYNQACTRSGSQSNCQPNLVCVPDDPNVSLCRTFCDPNDSNGCPVGTQCHTFPGDTQGHRYGLCYRDNGWGDECSTDSTCRAGQSCQPYDDPSALGSLAPVCEYNFGDAGAMAPCSPQALPDGGVKPANAVCQSGACVGDPLFSPSAKYYCFAACSTDADCTENGHTGSCDGTFTFATSTGTAGTVSGCRPHCDSADDCAAYGGANACRIDVVTGYYAAITAACNLPAGSRGVGEPCNSNAGCQSGYCQMVDGRGTNRFGYCAAPCTTSAQCQTDGGAQLQVSPLDCVRVDQFGWSGFDGVNSTSDDYLLGMSICTGAACTTDNDCDAGICAPDIGGDGGASSFAVLHCQAVTGAGGIAGSNCFQNGDCNSGVCGQLQAPSTGTGSQCYQACDVTTTCPGATQCRAKGMRIQTAFGFLDLDTCAP